MVDPQIRVWVFAPENVRGQRLARRDGMGIEEAIRHIRKRDRNNRKRYRKLYNIDIYDQGNFDICLNSGIFTPDELADAVLKVIEIKKKR